VGFWISRVLLGVILTAGLIFEGASDGRLTLITTLSLLLFVLNAIRLPGKLTKPAEFLEIFLAVSLEAISQYAVNPFFSLVYVAMIFERAYGARISVSLLQAGFGEGAEGFRRRVEENPQGLSVFWIAALVSGAAVKYVEILRRDPSYFDLGAAVQFLGLLISVAIALRFAQGYRKERDELARLSREIEALSAVREQKRISRELHDALGHALTAQIMRLEMADHFLDAGKPDEAANQVNSAKEEGRSMLRSVQEIVTTLREPVWVRSDFFALAERGGASELPNDKPIVKFDIVGDLSLLSPRANHVLYRSLQESLTNARRHSNAEHVLATISIEDGTRAVLVVEFGPLPNGGFRVKLILPI